MATNKPAGDGARKGAVRKRDQVSNPKTGHWTKRGADRKFLDQKADKQPFKGVRKVK